jgi:outer membrane lipoprotein SlyB
MTLRSAALSSFFAVYVGLCLVGCASPRTIPIRSVDPPYTRHARLQQMVATTSGHPVQITVRGIDSVEQQYWGYITRLRNDTLYWADGRAQATVTSAHISQLRMVVCTGCRRDFRPTGAVSGLVFGYALPIAIESIRNRGGFSATSIVTAVAGGFLGWFIGASQSSTEVRWVAE